MRRLGLGQASILCFVEDNWSLGRLGAQSFNARDASLAGLFDFESRQPAADARSGHRPSGSQRTLSGSPAWRPTPDARRLSVCRREWRSGAMPDPDHSFGRWADRVRDRQVRRVAPGSERRPVQILRDPQAWRAGVANAERRDQQGGSAERTILHRGRLMQVTDRAGHDAAEDHQ
jgi:hypothetical protein